MTVGGRRSGVPSGGRVDSTPNAHVMALAHLFVGGPSSASNAAAYLLRQLAAGSRQLRPGGGGGSGDRGLWWLRPFSSGAGLQGPGPGPGVLGKQPTPPSSSSTHPSAITELWSAAHRQLSFLTTSLPQYHHDFVFCLISFHNIVHIRSRQSRLQCVHHDDPTREEEYSPPGHQPKLIPWHDPRNGDSN